MILKLKIQILGPILSCSLATFAWANSLPCDNTLSNSGALAEQTKLSAKSEKASLTSGQAALLLEIETNWKDNIVKNHGSRSLESFVSFSQEDPRILTIFENMGFIFDLKNKKVRYPDDPWIFLKKTKNPQFSSAIAIRQKFTNQVKMIQKISDLPVDAENWDSKVGEIQNKDYYLALSRRVFPITIGKMFDDHEFQHFASLYHPDAFPVYTDILQQQAKSYLAGAFAEKLAFLNLEVFAFVRSSDLNARKSFNQFVQRQKLEIENYVTLKNAIENMNIHQIEVLSKEFLSLYPSLVIYLGGAIRESRLIPTIFTRNSTSLNFLKNWRAARNHISQPQLESAEMIQRFLNQNWRALFTQLVIAHNFAYRTPLDYQMTASHTGLTVLELEKIRLEGLGSIDRQSPIYYLTMGLAEMIYSLQMAFDLGLSPSEFLLAANNKKHPQHDKVKKFFETTYPAVYEDQGKARSIYYRAFKDLERL